MVEGRKHPFRRFALRGAPHLDAERATLCGARRMCRAPARDAAVVGGGVQLAALAERHRAHGGAPRLHGGALPCPDIVEKQRAVGRGAHHQPVGARDRACVALSKNTWSRVVSTLFAASRFAELHT